MALPKDVYEESGSRMPLPKREDMDAEGRRIYDRLTGEDACTVAALRGPLGFRLWHPKLAELDYEMNQFLRYDTGLDGRIRELIILNIAREMDCRYIWAAHEAVALKEGLEQSIIDRIKFRKPLRGLKEGDALIIKLGREVIGQKRIKPATFAAAAKLFTKKELLDLVALMANYAGTVIKLRAFDMQVRPGEKALLPLED